MFSCSVVSRIPVFFVLLVILKCFISSIIAADDTTSDESGSSTKKQFYLNTILEVSWFQAYSHCRSLNMNLASIDNQEEYDTLVDMIRKAGIKYGHYWLSGSDLGQPGGRFVWMSTGKPLSWAKWQPGEPSHYNHSGNIEHCVAIWGFDYKFNDKLCVQDLLYHACQF